MKIACLIPGGLGGTQKAGWLFAEGLAGLGHDVVGFSNGGPFVPSNPPAGLSIETINNECDSFPAIAAGRFDALHLHMPGYYIRHPIYPFLKSLGKKRPRVVETNVFGWLQDWRANPVTDYRLFISMTSACQAAARAGKPLSKLRNCSVARYPVQVAPLFTMEERKKTRVELGLSDEDVVALRMGRPDAAKWTDLECIATRNVRKAGHHQLKLIAIEPPEELKNRIASGQFGDGIIVRKVEDSPEQVARLVDAADIIFHAARFGESFGYAIAEGMAACKPVITRTTPWGDNAQVELVEHGTTGFVCCSQEGLAAALKLLLEDQNLREQMGAAGRQRILQLSDPAREIQVLSAVITGDDISLHDRWSGVLDFYRSFPDREWNVIEKTHPQLFENASALLDREVRYASRYKARKRLSAIRADLRSLQRRPAYG